VKKIAIIMGSASDLPVAEEAVKALSEFAVPYEVMVCSAHRTPEDLRTFAAGAREAGFGALICIAGLAAHLAGAAAALTTLPVVGVPAASGSLQGLDALLSTAQMPPGIPVATVAIGAGRNAALLCVQMLAIEDASLAMQLASARERMASGIRDKNREVASALNQKEVQG
jgi:5-(carboxyamino)imidazole ribonucleotide mutase